MNKIVAAAVAGLLIYAATLTQASVLVTMNNPNNNHVYHLLSVQSWDSAQSEAKSLGGHLVVISDEAEQKWVWQNFGLYSGNGVNFQKHLWIGLSDTITEGDFLWVNGELLVYQNWSPNEPNNNPNFDPEDWVHMDGFRGGTWNDMNQSRPGSVALPIYAVVEISSKDRDGDGVDDDDDLFPDDPKRATIIDHINCIIEYVSDDAVIFDGDWKNKKMRKAYLNKLEVILELVIAADAAEDPEAAALIYAEALDKVNNDLIKKTDGLQGVGASERDDWLKVQEAQDIVYPDLLFLSEYLLEKTL